MRLDLAKTAVMLIDVWANHPNKEWQKYAHKVIEERIKPLYRWADERGILIIRNYENWELGALPALPVCKHQLVSTNPNKIARELKKRGIDTIIFAGFAANECVIYKTGGIKDMANLGFNIVILRRSVLAINGVDCSELDKLTDLAVKHIQTAYDAEAMTLEELGVL